MSDLLVDYGLFLAKAATVLAALWVLSALIGAAARRDRGREGIEVRHLNRKYRDMILTLQAHVLPRRLFKKGRRAERRSRRLRRRAEKEAPGRRRVFVLDFHGDIRASATTALREEITAVLGLATADDEVVVRLENSGGLVHDHGLAASQLARVRARGVPLTVAVDKVAASGGYMMACVADRILAAPFAVVGSVGVLAQVPNFHRLIERHGVDFEQIMAGEYKRTVTMFGENTDTERAKLQEQVEDVHALLKDFVAHYRPAIDIGQVATGEHWHARRAKELNLVDELTTSDDYLVAASETADLYEVTYRTRKPLTLRIAEAVRLTVERLVDAAWQGERTGRLGA